MKKWVFGEYLQRLIEKKGGKRAGWTQEYLGAKANVSQSYIAWLLNGETSGKDGPPKISIDTALGLSKALNVPVTNLILAYQGIDPDESNKIAPIDPEARMLEAIKEYQEWRESQK